MSEIVSKLLESKVERIITLAALATNQYATQRGGWAWKPQTDGKLAALEANLNDPKNSLYGQFHVVETVRALYALENGKDMPEIRNIFSIPSFALSYGVVVVPTAPVLGGVPHEYDTENNKAAYEIGKPVICISTWKKSENPNQRGRGVKNALATLGDINFLPLRADLTRPANDAEITELVKAMVEARGVAFVDDVLKNLEDSYAHLLD